MKSFLRKVLFVFGIVLVSPLLIPFLLTSEKEIILVDIQKWVEALGWQKRAILIQLLALFKEGQEFRNLYYHRLFKGNFISRMFMYVLKIFYRECPYFFLDSSCKIGPGLFIQHGFSTIIMADIGDNCWINQQVTIGHKDKTGRPQIGNNVRITAGAKVIGNIKIGNNVTIGANAVVVKDVPNNCVVVGVPAYIIKRDGVKVREEL
ncbi:MAG: serine acetyltransferase [Moorea sp. SIO2B7]|nr:serine acetyltransferase [Moorena sp. SIO2B7]